MKITDFEFPFVDLEVKYPGVRATGAAQIIVKKDDWEIGDIAIGSIETTGWMLRRDEALYALIENALHAERMDAIWQAYYEKIS